MGGFLLCCFLQECSLVSTVWQQPERASPIQPFIRNTKAISQEDKLSLLFFLTAPYLPLLLTHSFTHTHTRCQAVISMLMNMNVNQWESCEKKEKKKNKQTLNKKAWEWQQTSETEDVS